MARHHFDDHTARRIREALAGCEAAVDADPRALGWVRAVRAGIEATCAASTPTREELLFSRRAALAHSIAASQSRESLARARARRCAARILELRAEEARKLQGEIEAISPRRRETTAAVNDALVDITPYAAKLQAAADTVVKAADAAPPRLAALGSLVETATQAPKRQRRDDGAPSDPADLLANHLAQPDVLSSFLSPPQPPKDATTTTTSTSL
ncbi:hypothetical protein CTAYLR_007001 [Chrysophaeum taylorii]|uniref:Uncharacterized protein n=1 Tax=Chrysophaeum taylorii TaxID=2483200 RepID=A0AAD7XGT2_9STRA|nr:hypothetical protein CTAYLR_007001 [Chrysophaeum taylorii]